MISDSLLKRILWGLRAGLGIATVFIVWVLLWYPVGGPDRFAALGTTLGAAIAFYILGGLVAGTVVGLLLPLVRWRTGAFVTGVLAGAPVGVGGVATVGSLVPWTLENTVPVVVIALFVGGPVGMIYREIFYEEAAGRRKRRTRRNA